MIIDVEGYAYLVPYVIDKDIFFLKQSFRAEKPLKNILEGGNDEKNKKNNA